MDYKQKYQDALEKVKGLLKDQEMALHAREKLANVFPELEESEDERIRKGIIRNLQYLMDRSEGFVKEDLQERIAWLEKQGEQKQTWKPSEAQLIVIKELIEDKNTSKVHKTILRGMLNELEKQGKSTRTNVETPFDIEIPFGAIDSELQEVSYDIPEGFNAEIKDDRVIIKKVEQTFKVGDWIVNTNSRLIWQITCIRNSLYYIRDVNGNEGYETYDGLRDNYHLWSISDAEDGDVLYSPWCKLLWIYKDEKTCHVGFNLNYNSDSIVINNSVCIPTDVQPATKEQRDLFFCKMHDAGYEWDADKKEIKDWLEGQCKNENRALPDKKRIDSAFTNIKCSPNLNKEESINIQEDYCSYELCKLLKEKGFDEECEWYYPKDGGEREQLLLDELNYDYQIGNFIKCPSHALVMKWLREIYHLRIDVDSGPDWEKDGKIWEYCVCNIYEEPTRILTPKDFPGPSFTTYEEAVEAAIKDILVNLI